MSNFVQIQSGNFRALVRTENLAKVEDKLSKVKPGYKLPAPREAARSFPAYISGISTAEYISRYESANSGLSFTKSYLGLNENPAAQYDPLIPLCIEDANPDYIPGVDDAPVKPKVRSARRDPKAERIAALEVAVKYLLDNAPCPDNVQVNQIRKLIGWTE